MDGRTDGWTEGQNDGQTCSTSAPCRPTGPLRTLATLGAPPAGWLVDWGFPLRTLPSQ
jgi:hypothetical protein